MTVTPQEVNAAIAAYARELREAGDELRRCAVEYADAEHDYKRARCAAYAMSSGESHAAKDADAEASTLEERRRAKLAEALWKSAIESVRDKRAILSGYQSYLSFARVEAELVRTEP